MSPADFFILAVLAVLAAAAVLFLLRRRKNGKCSGCNGNCTACSGSYCALPPEGDGQKAQTGHTNEQI